MKFNLAELLILERLLQNRLNADNDYKIAELHQKVKKEIQDIKYQIKRSIDWSKGNEHDRSMEKDI